VSETPTRGILFADLADSSRLYRELGDGPARDVVLAALELAQSVVTRERGRVVDRIGDELFCVFDDGDAAWRAAVGIQERTEREREAQRLPLGLAFRIGFIHGPVGLRETEVFGDSVYLAKRVADLAKAEQVLTLRETLAALRDVHPEQFLFVEKVRLKGRIEEVEVLEAVWGARVTVSVSSPSVPRSLPERELELSYRTGSTVVSREHPDVSFGRSSTCQIVFDEVGVSRFHARVELRRDGFMLIDQSRNGTVLQSDGGTPRTILHEQAALEGTGTLQLGPQDGAPVIAYTVRDRRG
jgi:adenylate cyclase